MKKEQPFAELPGGSETILVVDDDDAVRTLLRETLRMKGYTVLDARFNSGALMVAGRHKDAIHLMVADLMMPGVNGRELGRRLELSRPDMKILYISGYPKDFVFGKKLLEEGAEFLEKPITPDTLLAKVRDMLDTGSGEPDSVSNGAECGDDFVMQVLTGLLDQTNIRLSAHQAAQLKVLVDDYEATRLVHEADFMVAELHAQTLIQDDAATLADIEAAFRDSESAQTVYRLEGVKALRAAEMLLTTVQREKLVAGYPHGRRRTSDRLHAESAKPKVKRRTKR
ncbi:MAG TPA: response regulator [Nitrospiraceae bacterium]|nr:response regulator [Nitrospiraceae bacterium]